MKGEQIIRLLELLEQNAEISHKELATRIGVSEEEVEAEIKQLQKEGFICGYQAVINWDKENEEKANALIEVKVTLQKGTGFDQVAAEISAFDEVSAVYLMSGGYDFAVMLERKTIKEISQFVFEKLATLPSISSTSTHFILRKYKDHRIVMGNAKKDKRLDRGI